MSKTVESAATPAAFCCTYRGMKIKQAEAKPAVSVWETRDFKIGPYKQVDVVITGKQDYQALVMSNKDKCGLDYVIKLAKLEGKDFLKEGLGLAPVGEFGDTTVLPETLQEGKEMLEAGKQSEAKIEAMAKAAGLTKDQFLTAFADGTLMDKLKASQESEVNTNATE